MGEIFLKKYIQKFAVFKMKINLASILIVLFFSILISLPLLQPGLYLIHDDQHIARLFLFDKSLKTGQFPVRWVDELGFGFGYPLFNFYPPFTYMLGEIFHLISFNYVDSIKLVFFSSIFFSGIAMYIFVKDLWGKAAGVISSLFYLLVPYRALDMYVRGALAESFSFVWLPAILWSFYKLSSLQERSDYKLISTNSPKYIYLSAILLALLMITHNLIFLPFMLTLPIYLLYLTLRSEMPIKFIVYCLWSIVYVLLLSAFFWIPALIEKKFTIVDEMLLQNLADFRIHFVYPQQLWNWTWGFGGSTEGLLDGISFKIGKLHVLAALAAFALGILHLMKNKRLSNLSIINYHLPLLFFALFVFSAFMTVSYSKFIWEIIKPLAYLQFPWRFLTFTALFSSILAGAFIYYLKVPILRLTFGSILIFILLFSNLKLFKPQQYRTNLTDSEATSSETINWDISKTSFEYIPKGVELYQDERGINMVTISKNDIPKQKLELTSGEASLPIIKNSPSAVTFNTEAQKDSVIQANIFNFPGWQVLIDSQNTLIDDNNNLKLITFKVPQGIHEIKLQFKNTPIRTIANLISLLSMVILALLIVNKWLNPTKT